MNFFCQQSRRHSFTLIELLCIMVIIIILCGTTYTIVGEVQAKGRATKTEALLK